MGDVTDIWKPYRASKEGIPKEKEFRKVNTDIEEIELLGKNTIRNNHANIDLDSIRIGYATEKVTEYLKQEGLNAYFINASYLIAAGDYYEPTGKYLVAIASPFKNNNEEILTNISFTNGVIVTKAKYQNYYEYKGKDYSSILDPDTYYPADNMVSVTVLGTSIADAEAMANTLFLMTVPDGGESMKKNKEMAAMWAYVANSKEQKMITSNFYKFFQSERQ